MVRTSDSQSENPGSIPGRTIMRIILLIRRYKDYLLHDKICGHRRVYKRLLYHLPEKLTLKKQSISSISRFLNNGCDIPYILVNGEIISDITKYAKHYFAGRIKRQLSSTSIFPDEYQNEELKYNEIVKELAASANFDINDP